MGKHQKRMQRLAKKYGLGSKDIYKFMAQRQITPSTRIIIRYWLMRMRFIRKLRVYVQTIINQNQEPQCLYCKYTYGLQSELLQSIEDMFYAFLKQYNFTLDNYEHEHWTNYFTKHARFRTVCQDCSEQIETRFKTKQKLNRLAAAVPKDDEDFQLILMS